MSIAENFEIIADAVYDKGKQDEYDAFWDAFQQNGKRNNYSYGIGGLGWTVDTFKPKYDMTNLTSATFMFCNSGIRASLADILDECGVELSLAGCSSITYCFRTSQFTELPTVDGSSATSWNYLFADMTYLKTIQKLVFPSSTTATTFSNAFYRTSALENINEIEGLIKSNIDFSACPLSKATIINVFEHLSATTSGMTLTLKKGAVNSAFGIDVDDNTSYPEGSEYYNLRHSRDNWSVSYV